MTTPAASIVTSLAAAVSAFLDETHHGVASRVADYVAREIAPAPEAADDAAARHEARAWLARLGAAGLFESVGTGDLRTLCLVREAVAGASPLADAVVALQALGGTAFVLAGTDEQRARWLTLIADGRAMAAFAMSEPQAGSDVAAMETQAVRDGGEWVLTGEKHLISNAGLADVYVVFAVTTPGAGSRGITAFVVPAGTPGLTFEPQIMAAPHPLGKIYLDDCRVPAEAVLGEVDRGFKLGMMTLDRIRPSVGAAACGMAARALHEAVVHTRSRRQFGQPLSDFQLVREKLGRMATELDAARLLVYRAAWMRDRGAERLTVPAAMAKSFATEAAQRIVDDAVQLVGGRGVLAGHPVERLYRAVRALRIYEGATDIQHLIIAADLVGGARA
ncbi:MAG TPA: acyl-CoA dehydrogenase family protein [Vicinamibacterales bacterium]|nr:acyl-CoA dehydrogenase family protein [Vicinamibacterales bacterium]